MKTLSMRITPWKPQKRARWMLAITGLWQNREQPWRNTFTTMRFCPCFRVRKWLGVCYISPPWGSRRSTALHWNLKLILKFCLMTSGRSDLGLSLGHDLLKASEHRVRSQYWLLASKRKVNFGRRKKWSIKAVDSDSVGLEGFNFALCMTYILLPTSYRHCLL